MPAKRAALRTISQDRLSAVLHQTRGAPDGVKRRCRPRVHFSALSSKMSGSRFFKPRDAGANPARATNFLKEAPILDPRSESASPYRIHKKPAGGPSPAGAEFTMRSWRKSNAPVCQSGVGSASLPERTIWSCGV